MSRAREELEAVVRFADALPVAVWVGRAPGGEVVYVNREFEHILGITPPEGAARGNYVGPYGVHLPDGAPYPEDQMPFERVMRSQRTEIIDDLVIHRHDATKCYLRVLARPLFDDDGAIAYVVEAFTDITREVETERMRAESEQRLHAMRRLESVGSLAGGIAHDFNNLLAIVKLVATQLRKDERDPTRLALVQHLDDVAASAAKLTRSLLGFARRGQHAARPISLADVVAPIVELAQRTFERRIVVRAELEASADVVLGDPTELEQVVMNLVMNARDALPGPGHIVVRTRREHVPEGHPVLAPGDHLVLDVVDDGPGVDPAVRDRVFEPYVTTKLVGATKGTGLGLSTVYGVARAHGGTAEIAETSAAGTTMRVWLPACDVPAERTTPATSHVVRGSGTILVVDDEPLVLSMTAHTLESLGYDVIAAGSGREAVDAFRDAHDRIGAVVLDMVMPGMDGRETALALRAIDPVVRVVMTTGLVPTSDDVEPARDLDVREVLSKPYDEAELSQAVARALAP
ncbi:hybrid sensor histidine kinase/response regulator [Sandaracinus amylolyticus]|uniref:histidine kinase n=1 Tax=Sandaracinus amylolyticus TaxID=927083 RepID=A0A0F6W903_9BACT|nr:PAS domain-containing hybrid sensor histidine kinase/response regulator [Sandaracinus amylolyticus]AKF10455.1 Sensory box histidine kinase/response regulator [Sandaracinus amylolyticus]